MAGKGRHQQQIKSVLLFRAPLKHCWGIPLKPKQLEAVSTFMAGNDTFVSLPTGYGKSAIYAIFPIAFDCLLGTVKM